ncbi:MAG: hypothetical protein LH480_01845 [Rubrivivax sp.]|nr:hypothetical protein [Rubrivivax sp.]
MIEISSRMCRIAAVSLAMLLALTGCGDGSDGDTADSPSRPVSITATVGAAGGTVNGPDGVQVVIPAGALDKPTEIGISNDGSGASAIGGLRPISNVFAATPHGTQFAESTRISLPFDPANVTAGARPVVIRSDPGGTWTALASDVSGAMVSADISGFSYYAVGTCFTSRDRLVGGPDPALACPSAGNLTLRLQDGSGVALPVPRTPSGTALPAMTVTTATQLQLSVEYNRPPNITRGELLSVWAYGAGLTPAQQPLTTFVIEDRVPAAFLRVDPATVPGAGRPGGVVVRVKVWVEYTTDAFYLGCLCFRPASWTFEAEVLLRVIYTAPPTPTPPPVVTHAVGGSISGLTGAGLVLRNNAADNLSVAANATAFTFATPVNAGSAYNVTLQTQPTGQTCTVQNGSGAANAAVSSVAVTCVHRTSAKAWQGAGLLETLDAGSALEPQVAFSANGSAMAVWRQLSPSGFFDIYVRRYVAATGWGAVEKIQVTDNTIGYGSPQVALDAAGNAIVVFSGSISEPFPTAFTARYSAAGASWSPATALAARAYNARLAIDSNGNALVIYDAWNGNYTDVAARRYEASTGAWQIARILSADIGGSGPQIAFDANGNAIAVWQMRDGATARFKLMSDRYVVGLGWHPQGLPTTIASGSSGLDHRLAVDPSGAAVVVWEQTGFGPNEIFTSRFAGASWSTPVRVQSGTHRGAAFVQEEKPSVAMDGNGNAVVVWREFDLAGISSIWARRYVAGIGGTAGRIDDSGTYTTGGFAQIAMDAAGNATAVWNQGNHTWANRYAAGSGWVVATLIDSTAAGGGSVAPQVAVDGTGNAIAVWPQYGVSRADIWANLFK